MSIFGDNVKRIRKQKNLSQEELAKRSGYSDRSTISCIESGKRDCSQQQILAIANALGVSPGELLENHSFVLGSELKKFITKISINLGESYDKLETLFLEKEFPRAISYNALLYFFAVYLGKPLRISLSSKEQELVEMYHKLNCEGQNKVNEYAQDLLNSGRYSKGEKMFRAASSEDNHPAEIVEITPEERERLDNATRITPENGDF